MLWQHNGLWLYIGLLADPYFQVSALEAILSWWVHLSLRPNFSKLSVRVRRLQDETARVEDELLKPEGTEALLNCFVLSKSNSFENLLDPFLKLCRLSSPVTIALARSQLIRRIIDRLGASKAVVRLNLLRVLRAVCEVHPSRATLVERYGLYGIVKGLSQNDGAVLVRELAREILPALKPALKPASRFMQAHSRSNSAMSAMSTPSARSARSGLVGRDRSVSGGSQAVPSPSPRSRSPRALSPIGGMGLSPPKSSMIMPKRRMRRTASEASSTGIPAPASPAPPPVLSPVSRVPIALQKSRQQLGDFRFRSPSTDSGR